MAQFALQKFCTVDANSSSPASQTPARSPTCQTRCRPAARSTDLAGSPEMPHGGDQVGDYANVLVSRRCWRLRRSSVLSSAYVINSGSVIGEELRLKTHSAPC